MASFFHRQGDAKRELVEQLLLTNYNQYYRLAIGYVHNEADAMDIVQNGACKAIRASASLQKPQFAETWLYRIMLNECFQAVRKPLVVSYDALQEEPGAPPSFTEDTYEDIDLKRAMDALEPRDKAIIILRYFEDRKLEEIAELLEENLSTVKSRLYRSLRKLRQALSDDPGASREQKKDIIGR